jgi:hypothetical protein
MTGEEIAFSMLGSVAAFGAWLFPRSPSSRREDQQPASTTASPTSTEAVPHSVPAQPSRVRQEPPWLQSNREPRWVERVQWTLSAFGPTWMRELGGIAIASVATIAIGNMIRGTSWGRLGGGDEVLDFWDNPVLDIVVVVACIVTVRGVMAWAGAYAGQRSRLREGVGVILSLLAVYGVMWLATIVWSGTYTWWPPPEVPTTLPRIQIWENGYSHLELTSRSAILAGCMTALARVSAWLGRGM